MKEVEKPRPRTFAVWFKAQIIVFLIRIICGTLRIRFDNKEYYDQLVEKHGGVIFVTWHGRTLVPVFYFQKQKEKKKYFTLVSLSLDGDLITEVFRIFGLTSIRGSTKRRGITAAREAITRLHAGDVMLLTPDGPRGPSHVVQPGVVYIAQQSGKPICPGGISAYPRWILKSWDKYLIPKPFGTVRIVGGEPIFVRKEDGIEEMCLRVQNALNHVEREAEQAIVPPQEQCLPESTSAQQQESLEE